MEVEDGVCEKMDVGEAQEDIVLKDNQVEYCNVPLYDPLEGSVGTTVVKDVEVLVH